MTMLELGKLIVTCSLTKKNNPQESWSPNQHFVLASPPVRNQGWTAKGVPLHQNQWGQIPWNQEKNLKNKYLPSGAKAGSKFHSPHHLFTKEFLHHSPLSVSSDSTHNWLQLTLWRFCVWHYPSAQWGQITGCTSSKGTAPHNLAPLFKV